MTDRSVILIHGVWMPGEEMLYIKHRFEKVHGLSCELFRYPSVRGTLEENVLLLAQFMDDQGTECVDIVGHSLGGVLALRTLAQIRPLPPGRVVCIGSPLCGSRAASFLDGTDWGAMILGKTLKPGVVDRSASDWAEDVTRSREIGSIAGTQALGVGRIVTRFDGENDGTVAVSETRLPGLADHICLPVTHSGMVVSKRVADQAAAFLINGEFDRS